MENQQHTSKRIAKNTAILYTRMLLLLIVGLYTSRVVLKVLGVEDYGIYNVVGGFVMMFSLLSSSLNSSISRFLTFQLGKYNSDALHEVFFTSMSIQVFLSFLILFLAETIGLWFLATKMVIPIERYQAAFWVFQFSIFSFCMGLLSIPYTASIIAHEKMSMFAYFGIIEVFAKLGIVLLVGVSSFDHLIFYSFLIALLGVCMQVSYVLYCHKHFEECQLRYAFNKKLFFRMFSFAGWTFLGNASYILMTQGINILTNIFFGVLVNAARSVAATVDNVFSQFVNSFTTAINPAITKSYASSEIKTFYSLILSGSKYCFFLLYALVVPLLLETRIVLDLWLKDVPLHSVTFVRLTLLNLLIMVTSNPLITGILAKGQVKSYQISLGSFSLLALPLTYVVFKISPKPELAYLVTLGIYLLQFIVRVFYVEKLLHLSLSVSLKKILIPIFLTVSISFPLSYLVHLFINNSIRGVFFVFFLTEIIILSTIYLVGLTKSEKKVISEQIKNRFH